MVTELVIAACHELEDLLDTWNESTDPEIGNSNDALYLMIFPDGSGEIGTQNALGRNCRLGFDDSVELQMFLKQWSQ